MLYKYPDCMPLEDLKGSSCAFGVFDGFHIGHRFIVDEAIKLAKQSNRRSLIITFDVDPDEYFKKDGFKKIMSNEMRIETLKESGADGVVVLDFAKLHNLGADEFLDTVFCPYTPYSISVGDDVRFGFGAKGDILTLRRWAGLHDMKVFGFDLLTKDGEPITSTRIRALLAKGDITGANALLDHPYRICGEVVHGRGDGKDMGFKTANIKLPSHLLALGEGVYSARAYVDGKPYKAAVSVGVSPTFKDTSSANIEVHILNYEGDLYGKELEVSFLGRLRDMIKFDDIDKLIAQVTSDIEYVSKNVLLEQ